MKCIVTSFLFIYYLQDRPASERGFVEALVRRIKRLMQFVPVK